MGYVFRLEDIERYEKWYRSEPGRSAFVLEKDLLRQVWAPASAQRVLEVGCGSGVLLEWLASMGHLPRGLDPSGASLDMARRRLGGAIPLDLGFAEDLPYDDNEFDTVVLFTSLEFVDDPAQALREAFRVARRNVLLGALNRYSAGRVVCFLERFWKDSVFSRARFFSVFQLQRLAGRILAATVPIVWRTCFSLPPSFFRYSFFLERLSLLHRHPFGHFIAMRIDVRNRFRTVQSPLFNEIPAGIANASVHSLLCRSRAQWTHCRNFPMEEIAPAVSGGNILRMS